MNGNVNIGGFVTFMRVRYLVFRHHVGLLSVYGCFLTFKKHLSCGIGILLLKNPPKRERFINQLDDITYHRN